MKCLVIGLGKSGYASAIALKEARNQVTLLEESQSEEKNVKALELSDKGIDVVFGSDKIKDNFDLIVPSPAVPYHHPILKNTKVKIISEIELGYKLNPPANITAVTGTNGKTTTVNMLDAIYTEAGRKHKVAGNIGHPYIELRKEDLSQSTVILELSSFQLHFTENFKADIAIILNITEDHIDWHSDFNSYLDDKKRLFKSQSKDGISIINLDDHYSQELSNNLKSKVVNISAEKKADFYIDKGSFCHLGNHFFETKDFPLPGKHNIINALSACAASYFNGIDLSMSAQALKSFKGLAHRLEKIAEINGRTYIDDSKSTNPDSLVKALQSMNKPVILLAGGRNKDNSFKNIPKENIKEAIFFGEASQELADQFKLTDYQSAKTLKRAVEKAKEMSESGDTILLSPGCASFDEFNDYKHRGRCFKEYVTE